MYIYDKRVPTYWLWISYPVLVLRKATFILADQTVYRIKNSTCVFIFSCYLIIFYSL